MLSAMGPENFLRGSPTRNGHSPVAREILRSLRRATGEFFGGKYQAESRFSGSPVIPFNIIIAKWGDDRRIAIPLGTSSKNTLRSPFGPTGEFLLRPENGNFAWDFLRKNSPVAFPAAGELRFRLGRPRTSLLGTIFKHPEDGDFACVFLAKTSPVPADATGAWRFRLGLPRQTNAGPISNLTESNDWVRDFLTKQLRV